MKGSKRLRSFYKLKYGFAWCVLLAMLSFLTFSFIAKTISTNLFLSLESVIVFLILIVAGKPANYRILRRVFLYGIFITIP